jgi:YidC/Oxa1 family membrane protein insertase
VAHEIKPDQNRSGWFSFLQGPPDQWNPVHLKEASFVHETDIDSLGGVHEARGTIPWAGLADRYFLLGILATQDAKMNHALWGRHEQVLYSSLSYGGVVLAPGQTLSQQFGFYAGPKLKSELQAAGHQLGKSVDYGFFGFVAEPLVWLLSLFYKGIQNWGLAILALTIFVKMLLHPINKKSLESMKAMQKLAPEMKKLQEKFKEDKAQLQTEMMNLFKAHKVNPMGGCLPMLVQMPVYFALYQVLWNAVELYHAPFFGFYKDLSAPDPYMISPVLLGIVFYYQQKLNPQAATMDPAQQKIMQIMPLTFVALMVFLPFGLVLYILANTLMSVIQQAMITHDTTTWSWFKKYILRQ